MKGLTLTLDSTPPSANNLFLTVRVGRSTRRIKTKEYTAWLTETILRAKLSMRAVKHYPVALTLTIHGGKGFNRARDVANCEKAVTDSLVKAGILKNDSVLYVTDNRQVYIPAPNDTAPTYCTVEIVEAARLEAAA